MNLFIGRPLYNRSDMFPRFQIHLLFLSSWDCCYCWRIILFRFSRTRIKLPICSFGVACSNGSFNYILASSSANWERLDSNCYRIFLEHKYLIYSWFIWFIIVFRREIYVLGYQDRVYATSNSWIKFQALFRHDWGKWARVDKYDNGPRHGYSIKSHATWWTLCRCYLTTKRKPWWLRSHIKQWRRGSYTTTEQPYEAGRESYTFSSALPSRNTRALPSRDTT